MANDRITMCWVDLETTGLDANEEVPLEVGIKLTDDQGFVIAQNKWLVHDDTISFKHKVMLAVQHPVVGPMHRDSGLWKDLGERELHDYAPIYKTDDLICEWMNLHDAPANLPMVGNSIGSLDRPFVIVHFPKFNERLGYRNIDMSTLKELCKRHNPELYQNLLPIIGTKADAKHRVLEDIDASITEYRAYLDNFLFTEHL